LLASPEALAQAGSGSGTTFLHCVDAAVPTAPIDVTIDFAHNSANNHPATINATAIDWTNNSQAAGGFSVHQDFHIDRTTGMLTLTNTVYSGGSVMPGDNNPHRSNYACNVAAAPATKF
jgi:hypothetical protein